MAQSFQCTLVNPQKQLLDEELSYASIPANDGQLGVMHQRAPLMIKLGDGALRLDTASGQTHWYFVGGGFAQMKDNVLTLLAGEAVPVAEMDAQDAQAALKEAQARVTLTDDEFECTQRDLARARTMLQLLEDRR